MVNTPTQQLIHDFVSSYWAKNYRSPTFREIQKGAYISSTSIVAYHLDALESRGQIDRIGDHGSPRRIVPGWAKAAIDTAAVNLLGKKL